MTSHKCSCLLSMGICVQLSLHLFRAAAVAVEDAEAASLLALLPPLAPMVPLLLWRAVRLAADSSPAAADSRDPRAEEPAAVEDAEERSCPEDEEDSNKDPDPPLLSSLSRMSALSLHSHK